MKLFLALSIFLVSFSSLAKCSEESRVVNARLEYLELLANEVQSWTRINGDYMVELGNTLNSREGYTIGWDLGSGILRQGRTLSEGGRTHAQAIIATKENIKRDVQSLVDCLQR